MKVKVKDFLDKWAGDISIEDKTGSVYCSFRENVTEELSDKDIIDIKLERSMFTESSGCISIIV